jgi:hypothetical protein
MITDKSNLKEQNEYAKNVKGEPVYILEAESGRKGYWCMGCDAEMEAVRRKKNILHKSYFRHIAKDVKKGEIQCTFSNQDFRHNLAIDILQRTKRIKVPNLYKYAPDGKTAKLIHEAKFIEAHSVKAELSFYEDDDGNVLFGKNPDIGNKNLLIRPDVTFFDIQGKPILLVEIVVSHKLNDEKKAKIRRLGIDTIQIIIPKDSPENIAKNFLVTKNTRWVFNDVEQNTNYFQLLTGNTEGISQIDDVQVRFFRESLTCRENEIKNLIRSITRCLESQSYKRTEFKLGQEISRVEKATREHQSKLDKLEADYEGEIYGEFKEQFDRLGEEEGNLAGKEIEWKQYYSDLERRYFRKDIQIRREQETIDRVFYEENGFDADEEGIRRNFEARRDEIDRDSEQLSGLFEQLREEEKRFDEFIALGQQRVISDIIREKEGIERDIKTKRTFVDSISEEFERRRREIKERIDSEEERYRQSIEHRIRADSNKIEEFGRSIVQSMENQSDARGILPERFRTLLETRRIISNWENEKLSQQRLRIAIECIRKGDFKKWDK